MRRALIQYGLIRFGLWAFAVFIALLPTLQSVGGHALLRGNFLSAANDGAQFRDLLFVIVPASALSLATTIDFICARRNSGVSLLAIIALIVNLLILVLGFVGFLIIPEDSVLDADTFAVYWFGIIFGLVLSLTTELWVSGASERHRELDRITKVNTENALVRAKAKARSRS